MPASSNVPPDFVRMIKAPHTAGIPLPGNKPSVLKEAQPVYLKRKECQETLRKVDHESRFTENLILKTNQKFAKIRINFKKASFPDELRFVLLKNFYENCLEQRKLLHEKKIELVQELKELNKSSPPISSSYSATSKSKELLHLFDSKGNFMSTLFRKMAKKRSKLTSGNGIFT